MAETIDPQKVLDGLVVHYKRQEQCFICGQLWPCVSKLAHTLIGQLLDRPAHPTEGAIDYPKMVSELQGKNRELQEKLDDIYEGATTAQRAGLELDEGEEERES